MPSFSAVMADPPVASTGTEILFAVILGAVSVLFVNRYATGPVGQRRLVLAAAGLFVFLVLAVLIGG